MDTHLWVSVLTLLGAVAVGAMSPGPSFVFVARTAVALSRNDGLAAALGMGMGAVLFAVLVMAGLQVVLATFETLYLVVKIAGALYLVYMGWGLFKQAKTPLQMDVARETSRRSACRSFLRGFLTQVSNPKAMVVYGSMFAALLPKELPVLVAVAVPAFVFVIETGWYAVVALALSRDDSRRAYLRCRTWIDRLAGGLMAMLGTKLLVSVNR